MYGAGFDILLLTVLGLQVLFDSAKHNYNILAPISEFSDSIKFPIPVTDLIYLRFVIRNFCSDVFH
jgi:hypothetical protein